MPRSIVRATSRGARVAVVVAAIVGLLVACARPAATPLPSEAYVWQRVWTPAVLAAIDRHRATLGGLRVQAMAVPGHGAPRVFAVPLDALTTRAIPVRAVVRIEGRRVLDDGAALVAPIVARARAWQAAGVPLVGIEIDYDCASAKLPRYATWLALLRRELPRDLALSITALPSWLEADALRTVLAAPDQVVLQVHGVDDPHAGLFDATHAQQWIARWAQRSTTPFVVSLPTYATRAAFDAGGTLVAIESEVPVAHAGAASRELVADPQAIAALVAALDRARPATLQGLVWFRLPLPDDRRTWRDATFAAMLARRVDAPRLEAALVDRRDVVLRNVGAIDAVLPRAITVDGTCAAGDGVAGYALAGDAAARVFRRDGGDGWIRRGESRILGWIGCDDPGTVRLHVES